METVIFAGGCFWCTEAVFQRLKGVESVISGYAGGEGENPDYEEVARGDTGFAEAIKITFDPKIIPFEKLLDVFWATHDPTSLNKQGADTGTEYRSAIFYTTQEQKKKALESKDRMENSGKLNSKIVTEIVPFTNFYPAEEYHQNFYNRRKDTVLYCPIVIDPKIKKLLQEFGDLVKEEYK